VELFVEVETATHRLSEVMKKDPSFDHAPGWFENVSALGASLLVKVTGSLFRDTKPKAQVELDGKNEKNIVVAEKASRQPLLSLEYLVSSLFIFDITIKHDTIYALLAIAKHVTPSASDSDLTVEYTKAPAEEASIVMRKMLHPKSELLLGRTKSALEDFSDFTQRKRYTAAYESPYVDVCKTFIEFCIRQSDPTRALDILCRPWASEDKRTPAEKNFYENSTMAKEANMRLPSGFPNSAVRHTQCAPTQESIHSRREGKMPTHSLDSHPPSSATITPPKVVESTKRPSALRNA
jgi:hypothetical protein